MSVAQEYADARLDHYKTQYTGDAHGKYAGNRAVKAALQRRWDALSPKEKREAEEAYHAVVLAYDRTRVR